MIWVESQQKDSLSKNVNFIRFSWEFWNNFMFVSDFKTSVLWNEVNIWKFDQPTMTFEAEKNANERAVGRLVEIELP